MFCFTTNVKKDYNKEIEICLKLLFLDNKNYSIHVCDF